MALDRRERMARRTTTNQEREKQPQRRRRMDLLRQQMARRTPRSRRLGQIHQTKKMAPRRRTHRRPPRATTRASATSNSTTNSPTTPHKQPDQRDQKRLRRRTLHDSFLSSRTLDSSTLNSQHRTLGHRLRRRQPKQQLQTPFLASTTGPRTRDQQRECEYRDEIVTRCGE